MVEKFHVIHKRVNSTVEHFVIIWQNGFSPHTTDFKKSQYSYEDSILVLKYKHFISAVTKKIIINVNFRVRVGEEMGKSGGLG